MPRVCDVSLFNDFGDSDANDKNDRFWQEVFVQIIVVEKFDLEVIHFLLCLGERSA